MGCLDLSLNLKVYCLLYLLLVSLHSTDSQVPPACNANSNTPQSCAIRDPQEKHSQKNLKYGIENDGRSWRDIDTAEFVRIVQDSYQERSDRLIVDVREPEELEESGIIPGSINIPLGDVEEALSANKEYFQGKYAVPKPSPNTDLIFYCRSGSRSQLAIEIANDLGYYKARHYMRGYLGWEQFIQNGLQCSATDGSGGDTDIPQKYEDQSWDKLKLCIEAVFNQKPISFLYDELYRAVENMCTHNMASLLYQNLEAECKNRVLSVVHTFQQDASDSVQFLKAVDLLWKDHCRTMVMIRSVFLFLDRTYASGNSSIPSIWDMGLNLFGSLVIRRSKVQDKVIDGIIAIIRKERGHETVDRGLLKSLLGMLADLQMYHNTFELHFLQDTETLYHTESLEMLRDPALTLPRYLVHVDKRLLQEKERVLHYLHQNTRRPLLLCVQKKLIGDHLLVILERGFELLLSSSMYKELSMLYNFYTRFQEGQTLICKAFGDFIKKCGAMIVSDGERDKTMVQELLELKTKVDDIVLNSFQESLCFYDTVRESFETVVNKRKNKPAELIAKFLDAQLKSGNKEWSDEDLERLFDRVMVLFRYIHGKDVFEAFYKKDLAKRLLLGKSASFDAEKSMLLKLKQECGPNFTSKLEGMFRDMEISRETMSSFKETHHQSASGGGIDLSVNVLTMSYWPPYTLAEVNLPNHMAKYLEEFKVFYISKHNGRKLQWQHSLGQCVLKSSFPHGEKELQVSLFQTLVLLLFNKVDGLTYLDIREQTAIEDGELKRILQSLSLGKARVLLKTPKTKEVHDTDMFQYSKDFKHKLCRIKINQVQIRETVQENEATNERVFLDRNYQVDAAIVRIMKMRRSLSHNLLFTECMGQLRFHIRPSDLKKRIESLIERDYLRRSPNNSSVYEYIA